MRSEGKFEMNGIKNLNFIELHTYKNNNFLLFNKYDIILFQLLMLKKYGRIIFILVIFVVFQILFF